MTFAAAEKIADSVLYEGYALYPYRASSAKNRVRFQWGVLVPPSYRESDPSERSTSVTQCLVERTGEATLQIRLRFLHLEERRLELRAAAGWSPVESLDLGDRELHHWDEACEEQIDVAIPFCDLGPSPAEFPFLREGSEQVENVTTADGSAARIVRAQAPIQGMIGVTADDMPGPYGVRRLTVTIRNQTTTEQPPDRDAALRSSLVSCHTLLAIDIGSFISLLSPPKWAEPYVTQCHNDGTFPVLAGEAGGPNRLVLSSPIILYDHPQTAPESPSDLFDATEIDEILTLRTMTLTDDEKRQARGTDPRTAALIDHVDHLPPEMLERLHGAIRRIGPVETGEEDDESHPWWDPGADASVSPESDSVVIAGTDVRRGSRVRLRPNLRSADAQDMFLEGRTALVEAVFFDVDGGQHLAVTLEGDPGADLNQLHGRYRYFKTDEVEPLEVIG